MYPFKKLFQKIVRVILRAFLALVVLFLILWLLIRIPAVQTWVVNQAGTFIARSIPTRFEIRQVDIRFVKSIVLKGVYLEDIAGDTLLQAGELSVDISLFSLWKKKLIIDEAKLKNARVDIHPLKANGEPNYLFLTRLGSESRESPTDSPATPWEWTLSRVRLKEVGFQYRTVAPETDLDVFVDELDLKIAELDLQNQQIALDLLALNNSRVAFQTGPAPEKSLSPNSEPITFPFTGWEIRLHQIRLSGNSFSLHPGNTPPAASGFQAENINLRDLELQARNVSWTRDHIRFPLQQLSFREGNGFFLEKGKIDLTLTPRSLIASGLTLQTPESRIQLEGDFSFPRFRDLTAFSDQLKGRLLLSRLILDPGEAAYFFPELRNVNPKIPPVFLYLAARKEGNRFQLDSLQGRGGDWLALDLKGSLPLEYQKEESRLRIRKMTLKVRPLRQLLQKIVPLPPELDQLGSLNLRASLRTSGDSLQLERLSLKTGGSLKGEFAGQMTGFAGSLAPDLLLEIRELQLDPRLLDPFVGTPLFPEAQNTPLIRMNGRLGYKPDSLNWQGKIQTPRGWIDGDLAYLPQAADSLTTYHGQIELKTEDLSAWAAAAATLGKLKGRFDFRGSGIRPETMSLSLKADLDTLQAMDYPYRNISLEAEWKNQDLQAILQSRDPNLQLGGRLAFSMQDSLPRLAADLKLDTINAFPLGWYTQPVSTKAKLTLQSRGLAPENLTAQLLLRDWTIWNDTAQFQMDSLYLALDHPGPGQKALVLRSDLARGEISGSFQFEALPLAILDYLHQFELLYPTGTEQVAYDTLPVQQLEWSFSFPRTRPFLQLFSPGVQLADPFALTGRFHSGKEELILTGNLPVLDLMDNQIRGLKVDLDGSARAFRHDISCLSWSTGEDTLFTRLELNGELLRKGLNLRITTDQTLEADSLDLFLEVGLQQQSDAATLRGSVRVDHWPFAEKLLDSLRFTARLPYQKEDPGEVRFRLRSGENKVSGESRYDLLSRELNGHLSVERFSFATLAPFAGESVENLRGLCSGELEITGRPDTPALNGEIGINDLAFRLPATQVSYTLDKAQIRLFRNRISWKDLVLREETGGALNLSGDLNHDYFSNFFLNTSWSTRGFRFFHFPQTADALFFGEFTGRSSGQIRGALDDLAIEMELFTLSPSQLTVLPMSEEEAVLKEPFITFGKPVQGKKGRWQAPEDKVKDSEASFDLDLTANVGITSDFFLKVLLDAEGGDYFNCRGKGNLVVESDALGNLGIAGDYIIEEGKYSFSYEGLVKKEFLLQEGSHILFAGDPYNAEFDITAVYAIRTSTYPLIREEVSLSDEELAQAQKPREVELLLKISGTVLEPVLAFDIRIPEEENGPLGSVLQRKLNALREQPSEWNKQVFSLLLFNSFMGKSGSSSVNSFSEAVESSVYSSINSLVTQQLNKLAGKYLKGVELSFGIDSYSTTGGQEAERVTEMEVQLSRQLFNDRLRISVGGNVDVGGGQEGLPDSYRTLAGDFVLEYKLNKRGNYLLRVFHLNDYNLIQDETNYKTGLGIQFRKALPGRKKKVKNRE